MCQALDQSLEVLLQKPRQHGCPSHEQPSLHAHSRTPRAAFSAWDDFAPRGLLTMPRDSSLATTGGMMLLASGKWRLGMLVKSYSAQDSAAADNDGALRVNTAGALAWR